MGSHQRPVSGHFEWRQLWAKKPSRNTHEKPSALPANAPTNSMPSPLSNTSTARGRRHTSPICDNGPVKSLTNFWKLAGFKNEPSAWTNAGFY